MDFRCGLYSCIDLGEVMEHMSNYDALRHVAMWMLVVMLVVFAHMHKVPESVRYTLLMIAGFGALALLMVK